MLGTTRNKIKHVKGEFFVLAILLIFLTSIIAIWGIDPLRQLEAKYIEATKKCQFADEHYRLACYKDIIKTFLSEHPRAKGDFYKTFLPHIIRKPDLEGDARRYMTSLSSNCHVFMHAVGEVQADIHFAQNPENPEELLEILSTECRLGDRVGAITRLAKLKNFDSDYIDRLHGACLKGIKNAGEADMQQCAHALGHVYFDKYVFDTSPLHDGDFSIQLGEIKSESIQKAVTACSELSPLEQSGCFNAVAHSFYHVGHFFYHKEIEVDRDFSFFFNGCQGLKEFRDVCFKALIYRIGLNQAGPYFLTENYQEGNRICQRILESIGSEFADFCYTGVGTFLGQIIHEYGKEELKTKCELIEANHKKECYKGLEQWTKYLKTRKIEYSSLGSGLLVAGGFSDNSSPVLIYIDPSNDFAFTEIDLDRFGFDFTGIYEARPITVNGEYKIALGTYSLQREQAEFVVLNNGNFGFDNLQVEFTEQVDDARMRAVFVEDIDNDGEQEIVIGTRPHGILKYYKLVDNRWAGFDIDFLNETIHDILVADTNGNGGNEILATVSPLAQDDGSPPKGAFTGRILRYELSPEGNTWQKETVWSYNKTFTLDESLIHTRGTFEHPRYLFAADIDGDGSKEIVANILGSQNIELFRWNASGYSREIVEDKLDIHDSAFTIGDIDSDGKDEIFAVTLPDHILLQYDYSNGAWERKVLTDDLSIHKSERISSLYIIKSTRDSYGKILYTLESQNAIEGKDPQSTLPIYYLERDNDVWNKKYIGATDRPIQVLGIFPATPL